MTMCLDLWEYHHCVRQDFSRPGKPTDNGPGETFEGSLRDERLDVYWFDSLGQAGTLSSYGARTTMSRQGSPAHARTGEGRESADSRTLVETNVTSGAGGLAGGGVPHGARQLTGDVEQHGPQLFHAG